MKSVKSENTKIAVLGENENYVSGEEDCVMQCKENKVKIIFPIRAGWGFPGEVKSVPKQEKTAVFECTDKCETEIFVDQVKEAICGKALVELDISNIANILCEMKKGKFYTKIINMKSLNNSIQEIRTEVKTKNTYLVRIEGDLDLKKCMDIMDEISESIDNEECFYVCSYTYKYRLNHKFCGMMDS